MPRTQAQIDYANRTAAAQIGITPEAYADRKAALRDPAYTAAMYDKSRGNAIPQASMQHFQGGGTMAGLLGDRYEFLDRGGIGAPKTGMQSKVVPMAQGFRSVAPPGATPGVAPGLQPPQAPSMGPAGPAAGIPSGSRPAIPAAAPGFAGVRRPTSTERIRARQQARQTGLPD